ncbi:MAG: hypothetical protein LBL49_01880, partial [Clostridiales Family XIII bacterium]|nr:hypothetical protein [Clostridiales Family XIII bacterium]
MRKLLFLKNSNEGKVAMLYKIISLAITIIIIPMFFLGLFPVYRLIPWTLLLIILVGAVCLLVRDPSAKIPVVWRLPIVILVGIVSLAITWYVQDTLMSDELIRQYNFPMATIFLAYFPFFLRYGLRHGFNKPFQNFRLKACLSRILCIALIVLISAAIYFLDPFSLTRGLLNNGEPLFLVFILSIYSFALTTIFYRLELKMVLKSDKDDDAYSTWLTIPAYT